MMPASTGHPPTPQSPAQLTLQDGWRIPRDDWAKLKSKTVSLVSVGGESIVDPNEHRLFYAMLAIAGLFLSVVSRIITLAG